MSFFKTALAAELSVDAFRAECAKPGININEREYSGFGDHLIFILICRLDDDKLLGCLEVMHKYGVDLSVIDTAEETPVCKAASWAKPQSLNFLLSIRASAQEAGLLPAAANTLIGQHDIHLMMTKHLIETHHVDINQQARHGHTALIYAAKYAAFGIIEYLLSKNANLLIPVLQGAGNESLTALSFSFIKYISSSRILDQEHDHCKNAKNCLDLLLRAAYNLFYSKGLLSQAQELKLLQALTGSFEGLYEEANSEALKEMVREQALKPAKSRLIQEQQSQRLAFFMGSKAKEDVPIRKDFFQADTFDKNIAKMIFSFFHESIQCHEESEPLDLKNESSSPRDTVI